MTARSSQSDPPPPLSKWIIWVGTLVVFAVVLAVVAVSWFVLRRLYGGQGAQVQLDVIRTAGTLVIGTGGAVALLLTARRQRYTELALVHTDRDATERRITELYTKAAELLGSEQAPVRLAGLYALERLAHSTIEHRQSIVDVICAYLRMPYTPPQRSCRSPRPAWRRRARTLTDRPPHTTPTSRESRQEQAQQEQQVRLTAQNILVRNLRIRAQRRRRWWHRTPPPAAPVWPGIRLDLAGALLLNNFFLEGCQLDSADFGRARFTDTARFRKAEFIDTTYFGDAEFTDLAIFSGAQFTDWADFGDAKFTDEANFEGTQFATDAIFTGAEFAGRADFCGARFTDALFADTKFADKAYFLNVQFADKAYFLNVQFADKASFKGAQFTGGADFEGTRVASSAEPGSVWPPGWTTRPAKPDNGEDPAFLYLAKVEDSNPPDTT